MSQLFHEEISKMKVTGLTKTNFKILLVDDDEDFSDAMGMQLKHDLGCHITKATNPYEAMNALLESYYDLIILDWKLQSMSGGSALKKTDKILNIDTEISPQWDLAKVPVIIVSADPESEVRSLMSNHFEKIGFLTKLQSTQKLSEQIQKLIGKIKMKAS